MKPENSRRTVITSIFAGCLLLLAIVIIASAYTFKLNDFMSSRASSYMLERSDQSGIGIKNEVESDIETLTSIALFLGNTQLSLSDSLPLLRAEADNGEFREMTVIAPDGTGISTTGDTANFSSARYFTEALKGENFVSDVLNDPFTQELVTIYATPIIRENATIGVLTASYDINHYQENLSITSFGGKGYAYLVKSNGDILVHSSHSSADANLKNIFSLNFNESTDKHQLEKALLNGYSNAVLFTKDGEKRYLAFSPVGINDWRVISVVPKSVVSEQLNTILAFTLVTWAIIIAFFIALIIYIQLQQKKSQKELAALAFVDVVTQKPNWNYFNQEISRLLISLPSKPFALIVFDIDKFKALNALYGFDTGNTILKNTAEALHSSLDDNETFCRISADHFAIFWNYDDDAHFSSRLNTLLDTIRKTSPTLPFTLTVGIFLILSVTDHKLPIRELFDHADMARKLTKDREGGNAVGYYDAIIRQQILAEKKIEEEMENALKAGEFQVYLQPKYALATHKATGAEALVRWIHPKEGLRSPGDFIPLFERNGFVTRIDYFMFESICKFQRKWLDMYLEPLLISVNFSRRHLNDPNFIKNLKDTVSYYNIPPEMLELELTESAVFDNIDQLTRIFKELSHYGFKISIDDFGSGYSSLNLLKELPVDVLKLDKEFFGMSDDVKRSETVIESVITMAKALGIKVVAEGVETQSQIDFLTRIGCDIVQGYYFAKPMPVSEFEKRIYGL